MVQVHVTPRGGECCSVLCGHLRLGPECWPGGTTPRNPPVPGFARPTAGTVAFASLESWNLPGHGVGCGLGRLLASDVCHRGGGFLAVKLKILMVILLGLGAFAVWRKVQADRAELDLWNEATGADEE